MEKAKGLLMSALFVLYWYLTFKLAEASPIPIEWRNPSYASILIIISLFMVLSLPTVIYVLSTMAADYRSTLTYIIVALILTLGSGLYIVKPPMLDAEVVYFGFPFPWLTADRSLWLGPGPWQFTLMWFWFIGDFAIYILLVTTARGVYEKTSFWGRVARKLQSQEERGMKTCYQYGGQVSRKIIDLELEEGGIIKKCPQRSAISAEKNILTRKPTFIQEITGFIKNKRMELALPVR